MAATRQPLNWSSCLWPTVRSPWVTSEPFWNSVLQAGTSSCLGPAMLTSLRSARSVCFAVLAAPFLSVFVFMCFKSKITFLFLQGFKGEQGCGQSAL